MNVKKNTLTSGFLYSFYLLITVLVGLECILHIYNPFQLGYKGDSIILPRNRKMVFDNHNIPTLEKQTIHTKNSLGFRGPEPLDGFDRYKTIFVVGGSATECFYISDTNCWTNILYTALHKQDPKIWLNNAGFQGHSTYGHAILINEYLKHFHPKYIVLMAGFNEINRKDIVEDESVSRSSKNSSAWGWLKRNSELVNVALAIQRRFFMDHLTATDQYLNLNEKHDELYLNDASIDSSLSAQLPLVNAYEKRLRAIADTCINNNIKLVLVTQPILFGRGIDSVSGRNLESFKIEDGYNGKLIWKILEQYNARTTDIAHEKGLDIIDLASLMPKSSLYFYDICHFTNEGCRKVAEILYPHLSFVADKP